MSDASGYDSPSSVSPEETCQRIEAFMARPDIPVETGDRGYVEDIIRIEALEMEWDIGLSVHQPADPADIAVDAAGQQVGVFLLHGGSGDFKSMHEQADLLAEKLGYKVVSMSYPGRHAFHTPGRDWPGSNVVAHDHADYSLTVRTPIWKRGERIDREQYDLIRDDSRRPKYGTRTLAKARPGTTFYARMAGWPIAFEQGGIAVMAEHFPPERFNVYVHGHSTGGPFAMMLSQRVPNVAGILAVENSSFGYINRQKHAWSGQMGQIDGYDQVEADTRLPERSDPFDELYIRSWRDRARYVGPELLGEEGPEALLRLPMIMEDILADWGDVQPKAKFKAEYVVTHGIEDSLAEAARATADRLGLDDADTAALVERYQGLIRELEGPDAKPVPPVLFQIAKHSPDHSRDVYEEVIIPQFEAMDPPPRVSLTQFGLGGHRYMDGEHVDGVDLGIAPAVFEQWHDAITGGYFTGTTA